MQPKKQLKVQYIGIFEEIDSFYWPKMHFLKEGQKIRAWVDPPPLFGQCPKENVFFHEKHQLLAYSCKHQHKSSNWNWRPLHKRPPLLTAHDIVALKIFQIHYWIFFISFTNDHVLSIDETNYVQCVQLNWLI